MLYCLVLDKKKNPILWPPDAKKWLIGKDPDVGKDWRQEEKWTTEDEMVGWHHRLDREAWRATVHVVAKSQTWLSPWTELNWREKCYVKPFFFFWNFNVDITFSGILAQFSFLHKFGFYVVAFLPRTKLETNHLLCWTNLIAKMFFCLWQSDICMYVCVYIYIYIHIKKNNKKILVSICLEE